MEPKKILNLVESILDAGKKILPHVREMIERSEDLSSPPEPPPPPPEELRKESDPGPRNFKGGSGHI